MNTPFVAVRSVTKTYRRGQRRVTALREVSFALSQGELALLVGPSGSGKTTLLNLVAALDRPDCGEIIVGGSAVTGISRSAERRIATSASGSSSNLQPAAAAYSARKHSCADAPEAAVGSRARPETPRRGRSWRSRPAPAFRIERRRAAARRDCPGPRQRSRAHSRRRAGRQPRR